MNHTQFKSHVAISDDAKHVLSESLNKSLATTLDLYTQVKQAHWNIKGPQFFARHELFDKLSAHAAAAADELAERSSTLGSYATGTVRLAAEHSQLPEYELKAIQGNQHIAALVERYSIYSQFMRKNIELAQKHDDPVTEDLYTEVLRQAELDLWFLESHQRNESMM